MKKTSFLALNLLLISASYSQKVDLSLNLKKGATYFQSSVTKMNIHEKVQEQDIDIATTMSGTISFKVVEASDSLYTIQTNYDSLSVVMEMPGGMQGLNSGDSTNPFSKLVAGMTEYPFTVYMYKTGRIKGVKGLEQNVDKIMERFTNLPEEPRLAMKNQLLQSFGEKAFKGSFETTTHIFPEGKVSVGDNWEITTQLESLMSGKRITKYTLKQSTKDYYLIEGSTVTSTEDKDAHMPVGGMNMKYLLKGSATSSFKVDKKTGWVTQARSSDNISGTVEIKDNPQMPGGATFPMEIKSDLTMQGR